jgi:hypothetical protein
MNDMHDQAGADSGHPSGAIRCSSAHGAGVEISTRLTRQFRRMYRRHSMDISPQDVIDVVVQAGVKHWVLMGLHGYAGYLPNPRATQDVDMLIPPSERRRAVNAIRQAWPSLTVREFPEVVRFFDPNDSGPDNQPRSVIDLMMPWGRFQETILKEYVITEPETRHRIATLEAALVSKYAAMISVYRERDRKEQDAVDFRRMVCTNYDRIQRDDLRRLADQVWDQGADEIERFLEIARSDRPFPV